MASDISRSAVRQQLPVVDVPPGYPSSVPSWARPKSEASSRAPSRASSRGSIEPSERPSGISSPSSDADDSHLAVALSAGCQPDQVYKATMPYWTYKIRRALVKSLEWESPILGRWQKAIRSSHLDTFFIWSSIFGTHSAFMIGLPLFWWFGHGYEGRGLLNILASGVYFASFFKDLLCVPRPYTPPVTRLSISSHGLEYGFPSTHSTNAVSISIYFAELLLRNKSKDASGLDWLTIFGVGLCAFYATAVVLGRLYCGMHSMMDCLAGSLLGAAIWYSYLLVSPYYEEFLKMSGATVPSVVIPLCLILVSVHPEPVDDCPCFEDVIAFVSVASGIAVGQWHSYQAHKSLPGLWLFEAITHYSSKTPKGPMPSLDLHHLHETTAWLIISTTKLVLGIGVILLWRIIAKRTLYFILPPIFNVVEPWFSLPRRFYEPAKSYKQIEDDRPMQPIPSVLDLADLGSVPTDTPASILTKKLKARSSAIKGLEVTGTTSQKPSSRSQNGSGALSPSSKDRKTIPTKQMRPIHYNVDVLTKVIVYSGIGCIATISLPWWFGHIGLD